LTDVPDIQVTAVVSTVDEYLRARAPAQVVLLDLKLAEQSQPADNVTRLIDTGSKVLMVSGIADVRYILDAIQAGADGYLLRPEKVSCGGGAWLRPLLDVVVSGGLFGSGCSGRRQVGDLCQVVGEDPVSAPDCGAFTSVHPAAGPCVAVLEVADTSFGSGSPLDVSAEGGSVFVVTAGRAGFAFSRYGNGFHAKVV
jgi:hypothetical protein